MGRSHSVGSWAQRQRQVLKAQRERAAAQRKQEHKFSMAEYAARNSPPRQPVKTSTLPKITPVEILVNSRTVSSRAAGRKRIMELEERLRALKNEKLANGKRNRGRAYPKIDHVRLLLLKLKEELVTTQKEQVRNYNDFQRLKKLRVEDRVTEQKPLVKKSGRLTRKITRLCERIQDLQ